MADGSAMSREIAVAKKRRGRPSLPSSKLNRIKNRKLWKLERSVIYLQNTVFETWRSAKDSGTFASDSSFASYLLSLEMKRREKVRAFASGNRHQQRTASYNPPNLSAPMASSTPIKRSKASTIPLPASNNENSEVVVDITQISRHSVLGNTVVIPKSDYSDSETEYTDGDAAALEAEKEADELSLHLKEALEVLDLDQQEAASNAGSTDSCSSCESGSSEQEDEVIAEEADHLDDTLVPSEGEEPAEQEDTRNDDGVMYDLPIGPAPQFTRLEEKHDHKEELDLIKGTKVICTVDLLMSALQSSVCQHEGCNLPITVTKQQIQGCTLIAHYKCEKGHKGRWASSQEYNGVFSTNFQLAVSVLLSGNNFSKLSFFAKCLGLEFISEPTYYRVQRLYTIPGIIEWWQWMAKQILDGLPDEGVVLSGDGQCDSPGHSAKYLCYYLMDNIRNHIIHVEVIDKRETQGKSSNMEREALKRALVHLNTIIKILEITTDASSTIKKMLADEFAALFHSLDVWHKAKSIRKSINKVSGSKSMAKIKLWAGQIIKHFWYCSETCFKDVTTVEEAEAKFKTKWLGLLHHICGVHVWTGGQCEHGELDDSTHQLPWFDRRDKDFEVIQKIVCDPILLSSFKYYVKFRHTGFLESVNAMSLMYAPKRCSFQNEAFKARKILAAVDHNYHVGRSEATNRKGDTRVTRKFNPRTGVWNVKTLKQRKDYGYINMMQAKVFKLRSAFGPGSGMLAKTPVPESHPKRIASTIASVPPPATSEIQRFSRFHTNKS